jgi:hypothetical protein
MRHDTDHNAQIYRMRDLLEHLMANFERWAAADLASEPIWGDLLRRDLDECRRLCQSLDAQPRGVATRAA